MALIVGNKQVQSIIPKYDDAGILIAIYVRVNRAIVDDTTIPPTPKYGLSTSREVDILPRLTTTQAAGASAFLTRILALVSSMTEFEEP